MAGCFGCSGRRVRRGALYHAMDGIDAGEHVVVGSRKLERVEGREEREREREK